MVIFQDLWFRLYYGDTETPFIDDADDTEGLGVGFVDGNTVRCVAERHLPEENAEVTVEERADSGDWENTNDEEVSKSYGLR